MKEAWFKLAFGILACLLLFGFGVALAQTDTPPADQTQSEEGQPAAAQPDSGTSPGAAAGGLPEPMQSEMTVAEHWTKNSSYPRTIAAGSRVHVVEKGDTLWDLAQRYYNNPLLWPQIWDANKYIPNAHWIYPGDPVTIPPMTPVTEQQLAQETATEPVSGQETAGTEEGGPQAGTSAIPPPTKQSAPIALDVDLYCSGYILPDLKHLTLKVFATERLGQVSQSLFDVVYLNQGEAEGISPGDEFTAIQSLRSLDHPTTLRHIGDYVIQTARVKVVATQEHTATGQITYSCDASLIGDYLIPFEPKEASLLSDLPPIDRFSPEGPNAKGTIVFSKNDLGTVGLSNELEIDLGAKDGIQNGTRLVIFRRHEKNFELQNFEKEVPRRVLGEMVVFNVQDSTATGRIIQNFDGIMIGDQVEVR
jgi:LysM repeat protein